MLSQPHPSPLAHFVSYFVPLTERMFDLQQIAETEGRQSEVKVWSVLVDQIWSGLHGYCYGTIDLNKVYIFVTTETCSTWPNIHHLGTHSRVFTAAVSAALFTG
jgi:hypothetical protein